MNRRSLTTFSLPSPGFGGGLRTFGLAQKITCVFAAIIVLALANVLLFRSLLTDFRDVAATVNVAGKLRMLSQKMAVEATQAPANPSGAQRLQGSIQDFDDALTALSKGGAAFGMQVERLGAQQAATLATVSRSWADYRTTLVGVLNARGEATAADVQLSLAAAGAHRDLLLQAGALLAAAEALSSSIISETSMRHEEALQRMYLMLLVNAVVLASAFVWARRQILRPLRDLSGHWRALANGSYDTRIDVRSTDEIGQLALAFNESAIKIGSLINDINEERQSLRRAEAMFRRLAENSMVGIYVVQDDKFQFINDKMAQMFGYERQDMMENVKILDIFAEEERHLVHESRRKRLMGEVAESHFERRGLRRDGSLIDVEFFGSAMLLDGHPATIGVALDVTRRKQDQASAQLAALVYTHTSEGMVITDADAHILDVNPAFTDITGYTAEEVIGKRLNLLSSGRQDKTFYQSMWHALATTGSWQGELWNRRKNGEEYAERLSINTSYDEQGRVRCRIGLFSDITKKKTSEAVIWKQANYDHLTGLPNRQLFSTELDRALARARRRGSIVALIFLDLDEFKEINDTMGHDMGDELLKQVADRLTQCVRASDTVARLGGDEFTMIVGDLESTDVVARICQKTLQRLALPYHLGDDQVTISASLGVTFFPHDAEHAQELLKNADLAMYAAKEQGRNQYCYFSASMRKNAMARRQLSRDLIEGLSGQQFVLMYQPIVDLKTGAVSKAEALVRWNHPTRGLIGPAEFVAFAEDTGFILDLGDWIFREATRQAAQWSKVYGGDFQMSINVSPAQFVGDTSRYKLWLQHLRKLGLAGRNVVVEITERLLMDATPAVKNQLLAFRDEGIQVALDDFGTGYSSLSYLKRFDIDYIKIDRSFVQNLEEGNDDMALCEAIIAMAHRLGLRVVAEGVETQHQRDLLLNAGCDYGQGYFFGRPALPEDFDQGGRLV